jgi:hypothetical protein
MIISMIMVGYGFSYQQHLAHRYCPGSTTAAFPHHPHISSRQVPSDLNFERSWIMFDHLGCVYKRVSKSVATPCQPHTLRSSSPPPPICPAQNTTHCWIICHLENVSVSLVRSQTTTSSVGGILKPRCLLELFSTIQVGSGLGAYCLDLRVTDSWIP